ncbi:MAG: hypothetical protein ACLTOT_21600, partial [Eubacterium callanderi]|uniref:hypothetical protein n=1 Tax=Eubacterium callanderi TaxID=53442 RepID=UPI0039969497
GAKERPLRGLKEKVTSPFSPSLWGMEMMENLLGLPHSHTPPLTPITPSDFLPIREKIFILFSPGLKAIGGHILSIHFSLFSVVIIACPDSSFKSPGQAYIINIFYSLSYQSSMPPQV